jgi:hypothetical protein
MKRVFLLLAAIIIAFGSYAQVIVNPDGTHSVVHGDVVVNPNGTHSVIHGNVVVNPNGTHSVIHGNVIVNPDGSYSTAHGRGKNRIMKDAVGSKNKFIVSINGVSFTFDSKKVTKKIERLKKREMRQIRRRKERP